MQNMSAWMQALGGFAIGVIAGFAVRHARLCTFGAIEDALMREGIAQLRINGLLLCEGLGHALFGAGRAAQAPILADS